MRVHGLDFNGDVTMDANTAYITPAGNELCSQSILHIGKYSWNDFEADAFWRFLLVCTTGHVNRAPWYVGEHTKPDSDSTSRYKITWYIRYDFLSLLYICVQLSPIFIRSESFNAVEIKSLFRKQKTTE